MKSSQDISQLSMQFIEFYDKLASWEQAVVKDSGLSPTQMHTIEVIGQHNNMMMRELADRLGITTGSLTVLIDRLEKQGMVERKPHEHDRRAWLILLTEKGRQTYQEHNRFHEEYAREIARDLSAEERISLCRLMETVLKRM